MSKVHSSGGFFIAGTDTGVGKTRFATALMQALVAEGATVAGLKPVAAGAELLHGELRNEDALALLHASNVPVRYEEVNPYCLPAPVSPHIAAREAGIRIDIATIERACQHLRARARWVVVEGAGGWLVPIDDARTMADVAQALHLPVILVVGMRLGCLNHALLTFQALRADGLPFAGWVANCIDPRFERAQENIAALEQRLGAAPLCVLSHGIAPTAATEACGPFARALREGVARL